MLHLHDTATGLVKPLVQRDPGTVTMYVCGPTVYGLAHLGHGRSALVYDVLRRYLEWSGVSVRHVSNITDIDDKIINRAQVEGRPPADVARQYDDEWYRALDVLGVLRPTADPHATAYVEQMVDLIAALAGKGVAYETDDGVYLSVGEVDGYGLLAGQPLESLRAGERVDVVAGKRSAFDFVLWKGAKPDEPSWPSPWGPGRPGWHTECVVMSLDLLGDGFDLHAGGMDLRFPHHENERAQAVALGRDFARHWMHHAFVVDAEGEKMSKSVGNVSNLSELVERYDPRSYRLLVLQSHYRSPMTVNAGTLDRSVATLAGLDGLVRRAADAGLPAGGAAAEPDHRAAFVAAMDDDLDTPKALALVFDWVKEANRLLDAGDLGGAGPVVAAVVDALGAVGLPLSGVAAAVDDASAGLVARRDAARADRDWPEADRLRAELEAAGWVVEDTPTGTRVHRR
jgi:cysteinyl-tRNA synthetase